MSMLYRLFFTIILISASGLASAQPEPERHYRIELIVVRHLAGSSDSTPQQELRDLSPVLDLYAPPQEAGTLPQSGPQAEEAMAGQPGLVDPDHAELAEPEEPLAIRVDEMSDTMREAWRRLRGSAGFRPELFRAWEQSGDKPFPELRIHDDEVLFQVEPDPLLADVPVDEHGALVFTDQTVQQRNSPESAADLAPEPPPTQYYYRIDGTANLTRTRFLHLDLDVELREPLYGAPHASADDAGSPDSGLQDPGIAVLGRETRGRESALPETAARSGPAAEATAFRIHRIDQRRQVKAEQMEYFDGPVIGILALVTGFDVIPETGLVDDPVEASTEDTELAE